MAEHIKHLSDSLAPWGGFEVLRRLDGGRRNLVFLVRGDGDRRLVAKTTTRSQAALAWAAALQQEARRAGIGAPCYIAAPDGRFAPGGLTLEPFADGRPATQAELWGLKPGLARLRARSGGWPQRPGFASVTELFAAGAGGDVDLTLMPKSVATACLAAWAPLLGRREAPIHGDLNSSNLLLGTDGKPVLLDWDEARRDSPLFDIAPFRPDLPILARARLAWEVAAGWRSEPGYAKALAERLLAQREEA